MIRKFATVPGLGLVLSASLITILAGTSTVRAQQTPAQQDSTQQQQPANQSQAQPQAEAQQSSSSQETAQEEIPVRKPKPKLYKNWVYNVGAGASLTNGTTRTYARGGGGVVAAGVARNFSQYFGFRLDFQFDNLPLRDSALQLAGAPGATDHVYALTFSPIINLPVTRVWGGYIIAGPGYFHRSGKLDSSTVLPGVPCTAFFQWWGRCFAGSIPANGQFLHSSLNAVGENFGAGITRKVHNDMEVYAEFRYFHGTHAGITTDLRPITIGLRW